MQWYLIAVLIGALLPLLTHNGAIRRAVNENGVANGFGLWAGMAVGSIALFLVMAWFGTRAGYLPQ